MKKIIILSLALIILLGIMCNGTSSYFSDPENMGVTMCCWQTVCEDTCGDHIIILTDYSFDGTNSTWTYEVTSGTQPALSHWVLGWECDCSLIVDVYQLDENGDPISTIWECGTDPTTGVTGIKIDSNYDDGETRTVVFVLASDYPLGQVTIGMKANGDELVCEACGPVCELPCPYDSIILVSSAVTGMETTVTDAYTVYDGDTYHPAYTPHAAVAAWEPSAWNNTTYEGHTYHVTDFFNTLEGATKADWIWETQYTHQPSWWDGWPWKWYSQHYHSWFITSSSETGRVVTFERTFEIPCSPRDSTLIITCDNGYEVWVNGNPVGSAQVHDAWKTNTLTENYANSHGWETVETYTIPASYLQVGLNTVEIIAANEYMGQWDNQQAGTWQSNPAGLIYWLKVEWGD